MKRSFPVTVGVLAFAILPSGCSPRKGDPSLPEVQTWGSLRAIMHEGKTTPAVSLETASGPNVFGVGAVSGLRGEVTILDGKTWLAYPSEGGGIRVGSEGAPNESATLLVAAAVPHWQTVAVPDDIAPDQLDERIETLARANGMDVSKAFPVLIEGRRLQVDWHVLDGRKLAGGGSHEDHMRNAIKGSIRDQEGTLVGFFSKHHQGVFTHMGQHTHFHLLTSDGTVMGHADRIAVPAGSVLKLPARVK